MSWPKWDLDSWIHDLRLTSLLVYSWCTLVSRNHRRLCWQRTFYLSTYYISRLFRWSGPWTPAPCWVTILFSILYLLIFFVKRDQTKSLALTNVLCTLKWKLCSKSFAWEVCLLFIEPFNCSPDLPVEGSGACFIMEVFYNFYGYRCWFRLFMRIR